MSAKQHSAPVVVFARLPVPGVTKTRLAATVGGDMAAEFYKLCAEQVFREVCRCAFHVNQQQTVKANNSCIPQAM